MAVDQFDIEAVYELMSRFEQSGIGEMKISVKDVSLELKKPEEPSPTIIYRNADIPAYLGDKYGGQIHQEPSPSGAGYTDGAASAAGTPESPVSSGGTGSADFITSPVVGTFYAAPGEGEAPFVNVGDTVKRGQTVCIIEAMKMMNEISAAYDCVIEETMCKNEEAVGYKANLFRVRKI